MKKITSILFLTITLFMMNSCDYEDQDKITIDYVTFENATLSVNVDPANNVSQDIYVYTTKTSNSDRTLNINVVSDLTTADPSAYSIPSTVTIPANTNKGTITMEAIGGNLNPDGGDALVLEFSSSDTTYTGDNITININAYCPFTLEDVVGTWTGTTSYGYETQMVTSLNNDGQLQVTGIGIGFMENEWGEVITSMEQLIMNVDLETGNFTIEESPYLTTTYQGEAQAPYNLVATGRLTVCSTITMKLDYDFIQDGTSYTEWLTEGNGWPPFEENNTLVN